LFPSILTPGQFEILQTDMPKPEPVSDLSRNSFKKSALCFPEKNARGKHIEGCGKIPHLH
jgi:hypothetical protein